MVGSGGAEAVEPGEVSRHWHGGGSLRSVAAAVAGVAVTEAVAALAAAGGGKSSSPPSFEALAVSLKFHREFTHF